jgi:hypothetical protein
MRGTHIHIYNDGEGIEGQNELTGGHSTITRCNPYRMIGAGLHLMPCSNRNSKELGEEASMTRSLGWGPMHNYPLLFSKNSRGGSIERVIISLQESGIGLVGVLIKEND